MAVHIDEEKVGELATAIDKAVPGAETLGQYVEGTFEEAVELGAPLPNGWTASGGGLSSLIPTVDPGDSAVDFSENAPDTAAEIRRRLEYLAAIKELRDDGYTIDVPDTFADETPPSKEDIEELIAGFQEAGENPVAATQIGSGDMSDYGPAEIDAALAALSDDELAAIDEQLQAGAALLGGDARVGPSSWLFANASQTQMERLHNHVPSLEPDLPEGDDNGWQTMDDDLKGENFSQEDINQGALGDCWFLAALGSTSMSNPEHLRENITQNPNGSYTVTLYEDGEPIDVTVSNYVPDPPYVAGSDQEPNWVSIYEKAAAQVYNGGADYENIEGDSTETGLELVTGEDADRDTDGWFHGMQGLEDIENSLDGGKPVVLDTGEDPPDGDLVGNHAYIVEDVFINEDGERVIHVRNPWGPGADKPADTYFTEDEFHDNFEGVATSPNP